MPNNINDANRTGNTGAFDAEALYRELLDQVRTGLAG